jgi:Asp/Glu/hydantoin racemase
VVIMVWGLNSVRQWAIITAEAKWICLQTGEIEKYFLANTVVVAGRVRSQRADLITVAAPPDDTWPLRKVEGLMLDLCNCWFL